MFTEFRFPYGDSALTARIPTKNIAFALQRKHAPGLPDEYAALLSAIRAPIDSPPLRECVGSRDKVVVIVTDNTRACPDDRLLPPILAELESRIPRENITIIVALGLHAPLTRQELVTKLGRNIVAQYRALNHDASDVKKIGTTSRGTPVEVNRRVLEADFRISTGFIEPHFFAGFSGGSKSLSPGVAGPAAIRKNHGYEMMAHPLSRAGILEDNPIREDIVEQAQMAKLNFIVNVLLNDDKQITHVVAGHPVKAHEKGCQIEKELAGIEVSRKADITITSNSGAPLDLDLYQTCKGIDNASLITKDGGIIIIASSCNRGLGPESYAEPYKGAHSPADVLKKLKLGDPDGVPWQCQRLADIQLKNKIFVVSGLEDTLVEQMMMTPVATIGDGLKEAFQILGNDAKVAVIPEGHLTLPLLNG